MIYAALPQPVVSDQVIPGHTVIHEDYAIYCAAQNRNRQNRGIGDTKFGGIVGYELKIADIGLPAALQAHPRAACRRTDGGDRNTCFFLNLSCIVFQQS
ncbi:hypothetical protein [Janthinobacterium sp. 67]|uniref:hypothetical protein n=1 Tax=Janthinobacterium sp. 67 TaxID=2035207 RepID=UPI0012FE564C|nr:hypothetical protein [Janthinobacterium sp. 67]